MSSPYRNHKKLILSLLLIAVVLAGVFGMGHGVLAADEPPAAQPQAGNAIGEVLGSMSWVWGALLALLVMLQRLFALLVTLSGIFLNTMFKATINLVPSLDPVVQVGWIVLRDFVNGIFILLVLWIALTIILGIEQFGGKKLLAKVLAVAILINFSLAIVTAIVVLSNQFALAFYNKIDAGVKGDVAGYIVGITKLQTTTASLTPEQTQTLAADAKVKAEEARLSEVVLNPLKDGMLASVGFHSASAETCAAASQRCDQEICVVKYGSDGGCNTPQRRLELNACKRAAQQAQCTGGFFATERDAITNAANGVNAVVDFIGAGQKQLGDWSKTTLQEVVSAIIGVVLLAIVVTTFLYAAVALGIRYFALIFLTIASPIAFLTVALPMNLGKSEGWSYWWKEFMKWIFFAPAFYFLIYLTLVMAQRMSAAFSVPPGLASIREDPRHILGLFVVLGLLIYASRLAKKTSGKAGEFTVGLAKKAGGLALGVTAGIATGGTLLAARGLARRAVKPGTKTERVVRGMAGSKLGRMVGAGALQRKGTGLLAEREKEIEDRKKNYTHLSKDAALAEYRGSFGRVGFDGRNNAAILSMFADKGWLKDLKPEERADAAKIMSRYGMASKITKADPTIATTQTLTNADKDQIRKNEKDNAASGNNTARAVDPVRLVAQGLGGEDIKNMNMDGLKKDDAAAKAAREGILRNNNLNTGRLRDIIQKDIVAGQKLIQHMDDEFWENLNRDIASEKDANVKAALEASKRRLEGVKRYVTGTTGRTLGITTPANTPNRTYSNWQPEIREGRRNRRNNPGDTGDTGDAGTGEGDENEEGNQTAGGGGAANPPTPTPPPTTP